MKRMGIITCMIGGLFSLIGCSLKSMPEGELVRHMAHFRQIIEEEKMYKYKESYRPIMEVLDGWGWSFNANFLMDLGLILMDRMPDRVAMAWEELKAI